jgi:hypothetical protein
LVKGPASARPSARSERFEPVVRLVHSDLFVVLITIDNPNQNPNPTPIRSAMINAGLPEAIAIAIAQAIAAPTITDFFDLPTTPQIIGGIA